MCKETAQTHIYKEKANIDIKMYTASTIRRNQRPMYKERERER